MEETTVEVKTEQTEVTSVGKKKNTATGNLIFDIAKEVESLTKQKALTEADKLAENVETTYFRLGGVLKLINDNSWYEGFASFSEFVVEKFGFADRKARYLISIYDNLVTKQIQWEKVSHLGWTKLKELAPILTPENVDEWVAKAEKLTFSELLAILKPTAEGDTTAQTSDGIVKMTFKFKADQAEIVQQALAKAKGELSTDYDTVAIENICAGYVGGGSTTVVVKPGVSFAEQVKILGFEAALTEIAALYPEYDITATPAEAPAEAAA